MFTFYQKKEKKFMKKGFTLAEVLITLAIVGVVAAVSLPTLNTNVQKQGLSAQISKFCNQLSKGVQMYLVDNELDEIPGSLDMDAFVRKYFKITQKCTQDDNCIAATYRTLNSETTYNRETMFGSSFKGDVYMLADGAVMALMFYGAPDNSIDVSVDVNGNKGPNMIGYDVQSFTVYRDGSLDVINTTDRLGDSDSLRETIDWHFENCKSGDSPYGACFGHLLRNGFRFDY